MKKVMMVLGFSLMVAATYAQEAPAKKSSYPYWTISKDVQKIQFRNTEYVPAAPVTGNANWVIGKGINRLNEDRNQPVVRIATTGTPSHVISKGVARMQAQKK